MRIHPAASRIAKLSRESPCQFIVFDLLVDTSGKKLVDLPLSDRRRALEAFMKKFAAKNETVQLSPMTKDSTLASKWFHMGVGLDGIVAKRDDMPYQTGERTGMQKIKKQRTADCVVGGFRYLEKKPLVGSLLLGLYDRTGKLNHVGFTSSIANEDRAPLTKKLKGMIKPPGFTGKAPGGSEPLEHETFARMGATRSERLVVEVQFDHFTGGDSDTAPSCCAGGQIKRPSPAP